MLIENITKLFKNMKIIDNFDVKICNTSKIGIYSTLRSKRRTSEKTGGVSHKKNHPRKDDLLHNGDPLRAFWTCLYLDICVTSLI